MKKYDCIDEEISYTHRIIDSVPENMNTNHCHDRYEIIFVQEGSGKYIVEGVEYPVHARTIMIFPPLVYHCVSIDAHSKYERVVLFFEKNAVIDSIAQVFGTLSELSMPAGSFYSADSISDTMVGLFDKFELSDNVPEPERHLYRRLILAELILLLSVSKRETKYLDEGEIGARVIRYLNENMYRDLSLDKLAKKFFVSKYYLCRAFKKHNGISIHGYINNKRVIYAKQLIESGETASVAAYKAGFGDYSAFYRAYVKLVGNAPTASHSFSEVRR